MCDSDKGVSRFATCLTPYPDVNELLNLLLRETQTILGSQFVGMYLHGSLANGEFDPRRSDIDFLVVTEGDLPDETQSALAGMHRGIACGPLRWRSNYEGSYIPRQALRYYDPGNCRHPAVETDGRFGTSRHGSDWVIQRHIIREHGIALIGPEPNTLIAPVSQDELRVATRGVLRERWVPQLSDPLGLKSGEYQAYAILTMCRSLYTLELGEVASKPGAGRWARERSGGRWAALIDSALAWHHGAVLDLLPETMEFLRFTFACAGIPYAEKAID